MQSDYIERRQSKRLNISLPLRYQIRGSSEFGNTVTKNISSTGVSFIVDRFIKPKMRLSLDVNLLSRSLNPIAIVKWAQVLSYSDKYQVGLEFTEINPEDKNYISDYVDMHLI